MLGGIYLNLQIISKYLRFVETGTGRGWASVLAEILCMGKCLISTMSHIAARRGECQTRLARLAVYVLRNSPFLHRLHFHT